MKFFIDDKEIKTVLDNAVCEGNINLASRCVRFSYIYSIDNPNFPQYKVKNGSIVNLKNDNNENIFQGYVTSISYKTYENVVSIQAYDYLYFLLNKKVKGRFRGTFISILKNFLDKNYSIGEILKNLKNRINTISFGNLSAYDILQFALYYIFGEGYKIYIDGDSRLKIINSNSVSPSTILTIGNEIISSSFSLKYGENIGFIRAFDNKNVISGCVITIIDKTGNISGDFIVQSDKHIYRNTNIMELYIKERHTI